MIESNNSDIEPNWDPVKLLDKGLSAVRKGTVQMIDHTLENYKRKVDQLNKVD